MLNVNITEGMISSSLEELALLYKKWQNYKYVRYI